LLAALAFEHADRASMSRIEHGQKQRGFLAAMTAHPGRSGLEAGKNFVFEIVSHGKALAVEDGLLSAKLNIGS
jgi:hypothetical protein